jgi:hypothetical protein
MVFESTNELWNINIEQLRANPNMKPKKNPMHRRFIDTSADVFHKFNMPLEYTDRGAHNYIFRNDFFAIRISRKKFLLLSNNEFDEGVGEDNDEYISFRTKTQDEVMLAKACKVGISPRVYYYGNILIDDNVHRFCVFESYRTSLCKFIRRNKALTMIDEIETCYYNNLQEITDDIVGQTEDLINNIVSQNIVYYDLKPENVVINYDKNSQLSLKIIDWDSDFCIEEWFMDTEQNKECAKFLMMFIMCAYMNIYLNNKMFNKRLGELYDETMLPTLNYLLFDTDSEFMTIILQYYYIAFNMTYQNKECFDAKNEYMKERAKTNFVRLIEKCIS